MQEETDYVILKWGEAGRNLLQANLFLGFILLEADKLLMRVSQWKRMGLFLLILEVLLLR